MEPDLTRSRIRVGAALLGALVLHLLVVALLAAQLPTPAHAAPHAHAANSAVHHAHEPLLGSNTGPGTPYFDLTPPEVRTIGGPTLLEVLEAPPKLGVPQVLDLAFETPAPTLRSVAAQHLDDVRFGRAPPVS